MAYAAFSIGLNHIDIVGPLLRMFLFPFSLHNLLLLIYLTPINRPRPSLFLLRSYPILISPFLPTHDTNPKKNPFSSGNGILPRPIHGLLLPPFDPRCPPAPGDPHGPRDRLPRHPDDQARGRVLDQHPVVELKRGPARCLAVPGKLCRVRPAGSAHRRGRRAERRPEKDPDPQPVWSLGGQNRARRDGITETWCYRYWTDGRLLRDFGCHGFLGWVCRVFGQGILGV